MLPGATPTQLTYEPIGETGPLGTSVNAIAWHPDGQFLAIATRGGGVVQLWDAKAKKSIWELYKQIADQSSSLAFTQDGRYLIISSALVGAEYRSAALSLIDVETGRLARNIDRPADLHVDLNKASWATSWALNGTGTRLAVSFFSVPRIPFAVYDTSSWHVVAVIDSPASFPRDRKFAFDPISGILATNAPALLGAPNPDGSRPIARRASIELWDADSRNLVKRLSISAGGVFTYLPHRHVIVVGGTELQLRDNKQLSKISFIDSIDEAITPIIETNGALNNIAVNRDGSVLSAASWGGLTFWGMSESGAEVAWSQQLEVKRACVAGPAFSPKADLLAFAIDNLLCLKQL